LYSKFVLLKNIKNSYSKFVLLKLIVTKFVLRFSIKLLRPDPPMIGSKLLYKFGGKLLLEKCDWSKCCELKNGK